MRKDFVQKNLVNKKGLINYIDDYEQSNSKKNSEDMINFTSQAKKDIQYLMKKIEGIRR